jgi:hypothetical protein
MSATDQNPAPPGNGDSSEDLEKASLDTVYASLSTSAKGLTSAEAKQRIEQYGRNELVEEGDQRPAEVPALLHRAHRLHDRGRGAAVAADGALGGPDHHPGAAVLQRHLRLLAGAQGLRRPGGAEGGHGAEGDRLRDGDFRTIDAAEVVPGDVLRIKLGEVVPADVRFIDGDYISIDQAALTGESLPVSKKIGDEGYSGSIAKKGEMSAVVIATGNNTFFGRTASLVASAGKGASHSQQATTQIGDFLILTSVALCVLLVGFQLYQDLVVQSRVAVGGHRGHRPHRAGAADRLHPGGHADGDHGHQFPRRPGAGAEEGHRLAARGHRRAGRRRHPLLGQDRHADQEHPDPGRPDPVRRQVRRRDHPGWCPRLREGQRGCHRQGGERGAQGPEGAGRLQGRQVRPLRPGHQAHRGPGDGPRRQGPALHQGRTPGHHRPVQARRRDRREGDRHGLGPGRQGAARARRRAVHRRRRELELPRHPVHAGPAPGRFQRDHRARQGAWAAGQDGHRRRRGHRQPDLRPARHGHPPDRRGGHVHQGHGHEPPAGAHHRERGARRRLRARLPRAQVRHRACAAGSRPRGRHDRRRRQRRPRAEAGRLRHRGQRRHRRGARRRGADPHRPRAVDGHRRHRRVAPDLRAHHQLRAVPGRDDPGHHVRGGAGDGLLRLLAADAGDDRAGRAARRHPDHDHRLRQHAACPRTRCAGICGACCSCPDSWA